MVTTGLVKNQPAGVAAPAFAPPGDVRESSRAVAVANRVGAGAGLYPSWASSGATSRTTLPMVRRLTSNRSARVSWVQRPRWWRTVPSTRSAAVAVSVGAGGLAVGQPFGEGGQVRAGHAGQGRVGEQVGQAIAETRLLL